MDIVRWRLCLGCGACAYICPEDRIELVNDLDLGIHPQLPAVDCGSCRDCLRVCPAFERCRASPSAATRETRPWTPDLGPFLETWEGWATDEEIRFKGASGGVLTALALFGLEQQKFHGALHIGPNHDKAIHNATTLSRNRADLLRKSGSRYGPASACDRLHLVEQAPGPCLFIGQPAEVTALRKAQQMRPALRANTALALSFFCAGSPTLRGTLELLRQRQIDPDAVVDLKYRGCGWPGMFAATLKGETKPACQISYQESWAFLQRFRPFAVHLNPDVTGEDADISCGDPWYRSIQPDEPGASLFVVRTEAGRAFLRAAAQSGYLRLERISPDKVAASQPGLIAKRRAIWGRLAAMRLLGIPTPRYRGFMLFRGWRELAWTDRLRSFAGTLRRIVARKYYRPLELKPSTPASLGSP